MAQTMLYLPLKKYDKMIMKIKNTQPDIIPLKINKKQLYKLRQDWVCYLIVNNKIYKLLIYKGFIYDGASIPWIIKPFLRVGMDGVHRGGTLFHDLVYMLKKTKVSRSRYVTLNKKCHHEIFEYDGNNWNKTELLLSRKQCDDIMFDIIETTPFANLKTYKIRLMKIGIRLCGFSYWKKFTEDNLLNPLKCS